MYSDKVSKGKVCTIEKQYKFRFNILFHKKFKTWFIFLSAFYLTMWLMTSSKFSSEVSKLTSVKYSWNDAFSGMKFYIFTNIAPLIGIVLTKFSLFCI